MSPTPPEFARRISAILQSVELLPDEAKSPILHFRRTLSDTAGALDYMVRKIGASPRNQSIAERHLGRLNGMALVHMVETFERYLKEVAGECVDCLAELVVDAGFDIFNKIQGSNLASHFSAGTLGKALCESGTWLDCEEINRRFRSILADPFDNGNFYVFPKTASQPPVEEIWRDDVMNLVWQLRHTSVHNVGVITQSDAVKMRVLAKAKVDAPRLLMPSRNNLLWLTLFLDDTAENCNQRIGTRLAVLLTKLHHDSPGLLQPEALANRVASIFRLPLVVAGVTGIVPTN
jgi:hypothetical protein